MTKVFSTELTQDDLIEWDIFTSFDAVAVGQIKQLVHCEASESVLQYMLQITPWQAWQDNNLIGYGTRPPVKCLGYTEDEAYSAWIALVKSTERKLKSLLPIQQITQTQYDAMLVLQYFNGTFSHVGSPDREFNIQQYIKSGDWDYVCAALSESAGAQRKIQIDLPRIIMLADYGVLRDRAWLRENGLQEIRKQHPNRFPTDLAQKQAELVYYRETSRFLPGLTQTRKRQIVKDSGNI